MFYENYVVNIKKYKTPLWIKTPIICDHISNFRPAQSKINRFFSWMKEKPTNKDTVGSRKGEK